MQKNIGENGLLLLRAGQSSRTVTPKRKFEQDELDSSKYLEQHEIQRFFAAIESRRDRAIFRVMYHHGLRAHEISLVEFSDFRDRDGILYIRRGKGSISREHSLVDEELRCLRSYIKHERGTAPGVMFPSRQGSRGITRQRLDQLMKRYCQLAGIRPEKAHMHALKHSCGTHLAERGAEPAVIQDWLGHRDSSSTDVYLHFSPSRRRAAWERNRDWR
jgi:integrase/recombinase XerD